jgi:starch phosphorylase
MATIEHELGCVADAELWAMRTSARKSLVGYARERMAAQVAALAMKPDEAAAMCRCLDPDTLTLGFARRFATYKRPGMLLHDRDRLVRILTNRDRPVQLVMAGKAHPADEAGQEVIKAWIEFMRRSEVRGRVIFFPTTICSWRSGSCKAATCGSTRRDARGRRAEPAE